jgi:threonylcarbamoyladenosine tRNA methylthiotransferase MtaB
MFDLPILSDVTSPGEHPVDTHPHAAPHQPTCRLVTMGCKVNQYEVQLVREALERNGYREAADNEPADLCVINTCTVTSEADSKARQWIRRLGRENPASQIIAFGCYAARDPQTLEKLPRVAAVVGDNRELPDVLQRFGIAQFPDGISRFDGHRRAFVKVQDGCVLRCTYCIIPTVRPGLRSRSADEIETEVRRLVDFGHREIVLTGIHLGHYGVDTTRGKSGQPPFRLPHLIERLNAIPGGWRLRLSSLEADEVDGEFLARTADCERLVPHFHLCLQSGADSVLARMRRRYRSGAFLRNVEAIQRRFDRPALTTDVIVGFPGETEAEFAQTLHVCQQAGFSKIHAFPYSPRRGTAAAEFTEQVPPEAKEDRTNRLLALDRQLRREYHRTLVGKTLDVLVEARPASRAGFVTGTACRFVDVEFPGTRDEIGQMVSVRLTDVSSEFPAGDRVLPDTELDGLAGTGGGGRGEADASGLSAWAAVGQPVF